MLVLAGCGDREPEQTPNEVIKQVNANGTITDPQAEMLSKIEGTLYLNGLSSITDEQAESLSKVENLKISEDLQPLIDKYKKQ